MSHFSYSISYVLAIETRYQNWGVKVEQSPFLFRSGQRILIIQPPSPPPSPAKKKLHAVDGVIRVTNSVATMNTGETKAPTSRSSPQSARLISSNNSKLVDNRVNVSNLFLQVSEANRLSSQEAEFIDAKTTLSSCYTQHT